MSEYVRNKGVIQELYPEIETPDEKILQLSMDKIIPLDDLVYIYDDGTVDWDLTDSEDYSLINDRLFDVSAVPDEYDVEQDQEDIKPLGNGKYEVNLYYYNGGTNMEEIVSRYLQKEESGTASPKSVLYAIKVNSSYLIPAPASTQFTGNSILTFPTEEAANQYIVSTYGESPQDVLEVISLVER